MNSEAETQALEAARNIVKTVQDKAKDVGTFIDRIDKETKQRKRKKIYIQMKNTFDYLKSINFTGDFDVIEETQKFSEDLFYAIKQNRLHEVLEMLDKHPDKINVIDKNKLTPLHWAVKRNYLTLAEMLIKRGSNKNAIDILGRTPLHLAAKQNYFEMCKLLLRHKVSFKIKNKNGLAAADMAASDDILNLINKARRFEVINRMGINSPTKLMREAEKQAFQGRDDLS
mmetsp:Transcript_36459/g.35304  ORF Transcript_36459/g.35304 Transcript_36459/m.35304 type:complete len:228 (+) Transcript_36459:76-759(+)